MYWLKTIREHLQLSQGELAGYLGLSLHTIKSVEMGRRQLPFSTMNAALVIFNAVKESSLNAAERNATPPKLTHVQVQRKKHYLRTCMMSLERNSMKLHDMQKCHAQASSSLDTYQRLVQALTPALDEENQARLQWAQRKITEATQSLKVNSVAAQDLLFARVAGIRSRLNTLLKEQQELNADAPEDHEQPQTTQHDGTRPDQRL
jgi:transcriptional regulator with XRE-family HTH domain